MLLDAVFGERPLLRLFERRRILKGKSVFLHVFCDRICDIIKKRKGFSYIVRAVPLGRRPTTLLFRTCTADCLEEGKQQ